MLAALAAAPHPALAELMLAGVPLTADLLDLIAAAAPRGLRKLQLNGYDLAAAWGLPGGLSGPPSSGPRGLQGLLRLAAPHLRELNLLLSNPAGAAAAPGEEARDGLGALLQRCSRLEKLWLYPAPQAAEDLSVLPALAQLPSLRAFLFARAAGVPWQQTALSSLSRLTRLTTRAELGVALPALAAMRGLIELDLTTPGLRADHLAQLAALTALTRLSLSHLGAAEAQQPAAAAAGPHPSSAAGPGPGPAGAAGLPLPPALRSLWLKPSVDVAALAALRLPASLTRLDARGMRLSLAAMDPLGDLTRGVLRPAEAADVLASCRQLAGRYQEGAEPYDTTPLRVLLAHARAPPSWHGGFAPLFAALQPLALRRLCLSCAPLSARDVEALVAHLPLLEVLDLRSGLHLPALPALGGLAGLRRLQLHQDGVQWEEALVAEWESEASLRAAMLALCAQAPRLEAVTLHHARVVVRPQMAGVARAARDWLTGQLPGLRADPPVVVVQGYYEEHRFTDESDGGESDGVGDGWEVDAGSDGDGGGGESDGDGGGNGDADGGDAGDGGGGGEDD